MPAPPSTSGIDASCDASTGVPLAIASIERQAEAFVERRIDERDRAPIERVERDPR